MRCDGDASIRWLQTAPLPEEGALPPPRMAALPPMPLSVEQKRDQFFALLQHEGVRLRPAPCWLAVHLSSCRTLAHAELGAHQLHCDVGYMGWANRGDIP